jgi:hypothetical protein
MEYWIEDAAANVVPSSPILVTLMMEALSSSHTLVLTRATRRIIAEDTDLIYVWFERVDWIIMPSDGVQIVVLFTW